MTTLLASSSDDTLYFANRRASFSQRQIIARLDEVEAYIINIAKDTDLSSLLVLDLVRAAKKNMEIHNAIEFSTRAVEVFPSTVTILEAAKATANLHGAVSWDPILAISIDSVISTIEFWHRQLSNDIEEAKVK